MNEEPSMKANTVNNASMTLPTSERKGVPLDEEQNKACLII